MLIFYLYMYTDEATVTSHSLELYPMLKHVELGVYSELDRLDTEVIANGAWTKIDIGLGRHRDKVSIHFNLMYSGGGGKFSDNAAVAVDQIEFFNCGIPPARESCESDQFHCAITKACVPNGVICDYADDCGDSTDEGLADVDCEADYIRTNFEDPVQPFGFFRQDHPAADFEWVRGNGSTANHGTGKGFQ
jgi:hypothetical protein